MSHLWKLLLIPPQAKSQLQSVLPSDPAGISTIGRVVWRSISFVNLQPLKAGPHLRSFFCSPHSAHHQARDAKGASPWVPRSSAASSQAGRGALQETRRDCSWASTATWRRPSARFDAMERAAGPAASPTPAWAPEAQLRRRSWHKPGYYGNHHDYYHCGNHCLCSCLQFKELLFHTHYFTQSALQPWEVGRA